MTIRCEICTQSITAKDVTTFAIIVEFAYNDPFNDDEHVNPEFTHKLCREKADAELEESEK